MKKSILLVTFMFFSSFLLYAQDWHTNIDEAKQFASKNNQKVLLVFQGSDWCAPCIKLDNQIFKSEEFQTLIRNKFVMVKADFPRKKSNKLSPEQELKNNKLAEIYNTQGFFPLVVILDNQGKVLGKLGYENISPKDYYTKLIAFK